MIDDLLDKLSAEIEVNKQKRMRCWNHATRLSRKYVNRRGFRKRLRAYSSEKGMSLSDGLIEMLLRETCSGYYRLKKKIDDLDLQIDLLNKVRSNYSSAGSRG